MFLNPFLSYYNFSLFFFFRRFFAFLRLIYWPEHFLNTDHKDDQWIWYKPMFVWCSMSFLPANCAKISTSTLSWSKNCWRYEVVQASDFDYSINSLFVVKWSKIFKSLEFLGLGSMVNGQETERFDKNRGQTFFHQPIPIRKAKTND